MSDIKQTPEERIDAIQALKKKINDDFVQLGQLLSDIKEGKGFKFYGYTNFRDFVAEKLGFPMSLANNLIRIYDEYLVNFKVDQDTVEKIGMDKLNAIYPVFSKGDAEERDGWIQDAQDMTPQDLKEKVKEYRKKLQNKTKGLKDLYVEQFIDEMTTLFNCSAKEIWFKFALFFNRKFDLHIQEHDVVVMRDEIKDILTRMKNIPELTKIDFLPYLINLKNRELADDQDALRLFIKEAQYAFEAEAQKQGGQDE